MSPRPASVVEQRGSVRQPQLIPTGDGHARLAILPSTRKSLVARVEDAAGSSLRSFDAEERG